MVIVGDRHREGGGGSCVGDTAERMPIPTPYQSRPHVHPFQAESSSSNDGHNELYLGERLELESKEIMSIY